MANKTRTVSTHGYILGDLSVRGVSPCGEVSAYDYLTGKKAKPVNYAEMDNHTLKESISLTNDATRLLSLLIERGLRDGDEAAVRASLEVLIGQEIEDALGDTPRGHTVRRLRAMYASLSK